MAWVSALALFVALIFTGFSLVSVASKTPAFFICVALAYIAELFFLVKNLFYLRRSSKSALGDFFVFLSWFALAPFPLYILFVIWLYVSNPSL